jgi:hypothetical protein
VQNNQQRLILLKKYAKIKEIKATFTYETRKENAAIAARTPSYSTSGVDHPRNTDGFRSCFFTGGKHSVS